jgi:hypothetical protein
MNKILMVGRGHRITPGHDPPALKRPRELIEKGVEDPDDQQDEGHSHGTHECRDGSPGSPNVERVLVNPTKPGDFGDSERDNGHDEERCHKPEQNARSGLLPAHSMTRHARDFDDGLHVPLPPFL